MAVRGLQPNALEQGVEPELVGQRIAELRAEKDRAEAAVRQLAPSATEPDGEELAAALERIRTSARRARSSAGSQASPLSPWKGA